MNVANSFSLKKTDKEVLKSLLLWTPWDKRPLEGLEDSLVDRLTNLSDNFNECYVDPNKDKSGITACQGLEKLLETTNFNPVYIVGFSGSGKTTFLNHSINDLCKTNNDNSSIKKEYHVFDIINDEYPIPREPWASWFERLSSTEVMQCVIKAISSEIYALLGAVSGVELTVELKCMLQRIYSNYDNVIFRKAIHNEFVPVFNLVRSLLANNIEYTYDTDDMSNYEKSDSESYIDQVYRAVFKCCIQSDSGEDTAILHLLRLYTILRMCSLDEKDLLSGNYRFYFAFDNIEHFINQKVVLDNDVVRIIKSIKNYILNMNAKYEVFGLLYKQNRLYPFSSRIRIVLSIRETTSVIDEEISVDTHTYTNINRSVIVTNSFDLYLITKKKLEFLDKYHLLPALDSQGIKIRDLLLLMLSDKINENYAERYNVARNLWDMISTMYSFNKRRIIDNLIECLFDKDGKLRSSELNSYKQLWNAAISENEERRSIYANAARQIIFRLILDKICGNSSSRNYFVDIDAQKTTLMFRRITTYLGRHNPRKFISFSSLIKDIIISTHGENIQLAEVKKNYPEELRMLSCVLYTMRSRERAYHWCPLIIVKIQHDFEFQTPESVYEILANICDGNIAETTAKGIQYGLKISVAGRRFATFSVEYEYFAARYDGKSPPLFDEKNLSKSNEGKYPFINAMESVSHNALSSIKDSVEIDKMIAESSEIVNYAAIYSSDLRMFDSGNVKHLYRQYNYFSYTHAGNEQTHAERIIISHIGYIDRFRNYFLIRNHDQIAMYISWKCNIDWRENIKPQELDGFLVTLPKEIRPIAKAVIEILTILKKYVMRYNELSSYKSSGTYYLGGKNRVSLRYWQCDKILKNYAIILKNPLNSALSILDM
jgi:hypothetical protein